MPTVLLESAKSLLLELFFNETLLSTGTGFLAKSKANKYVLVTNRHNFTGRHQITGQPLSAHGGVPNRVVVWHNHTSGPGSRHKESYPILENDLPLWKEHPILGSKADVVALPIWTSFVVATYEYFLDKPSPAIKVHPGEPLSVIGFPFGLSAGGFFAIWATGFLATEMAVDYDNLPVFLIDCRARKGQSGSPVVASRSGGAVSLEDGSTSFFDGPVSNFLGIYSGRVNEESDLGMVWKRHVIQELVASL